MPSFKSTVLAVAAALVTSVSADYYISPDSVPLSVRQSWCRSEKSTCPIICQQTPPFTTLTNTCDPATLTYGCVCGNGLQPNVSEYSLTLPFFVCQEWGNQCVLNCGITNNQCSSDCRQNNPCGALNPSKPNTTLTTGIPTSTVASATSDATDVIHTGLAGGDGRSSNSNWASPGVDASRSFGFVVLMGSLVAGFALVL